MARVIHLPACSGTGPWRRPALNLGALTLAGRSVQQPRSRRTRPACCWPVAGESFARAAHETHNMLASMADFVASRRCCGEWPCGASLTDDPPASRSKILSLWHAPVSIRRALSVLGGPIVSCRDHRPCGSAERQAHSRRMPKLVTCQSALEPALLEVQQSDKSYCLRIVAASLARNWALTFLGLAEDGILGDQQTFASSQTQPLAARTRYTYAGAIRVMFGLPISIDLRTRLWTPW